MAKKRITVTVDDDVASYLHDQLNTSAVVSEAVRDYRARQLEHELETAYREDADATANLATEWETADAEVDE